MSNVKRIALLSASWDVRSVRGVYRAVPASANNVYGSIVIGYVSANQGH